MCRHSGEACAGLDPVAGIQEFLLFTGCRITALPFYPKGHAPA